jgi:hypothetical protein
MVLYWLEKPTNKKFSFWLPLGRLFKCILRCHPLWFLVFRNINWNPIVGYPYLLLFPETVFCAWSIVETPKIRIIIIFH